MKANPVGLIVTGITLLVTALVTLYNKSETVRNAVNAAFDAIRSKASDVVAAFQSFFADPFGTLRTAVQNIVSWVKEHLRFGSFELPHVSLPHFSISPAGWKVGDLLKGSIPTLSVSWYAKGAVFDSPTLFATPYGLKGVGEAGPEAVAPVSVLQGYIAQAVAGAGNTYVINGVTVAEGSAAADAAEALVDALGLRRRAGY